MYTMAIWPVHLSTWRELQYGWTQSPPNLQISATGVVGNKELSSLSSNKSNNTLQSERNWSTQQNGKSLVKLLILEEDWSN